MGASWSRSRLAVTFLWQLMQEIGFGLHMTFWWWIVSDFWLKGLKKKVTENFVSKFLYHRPSPSKVTSFQISPPFPKLKVCKIHLANKLQWTFKRRNKTAGHVFLLSLSFIYFYTFLPQSCYQVFFFTRALFLHPPLSLVQYWHLICVHTRLVSIFFSFEMRWGNKKHDRL